MRGWLLAMLPALLAGCAHVDYAERARSPMPPMHVTAGKTANFDKPPRLLKGLRPDYPYNEGLRREPGFAIIICTITTDGKATDFAVEDTSNIDFAIEAIRAIQRWKWAPAIKGGKPVAQRIRVPMRFRA